MISEDVVQQMKADVSKAIQIAVQEGIPENSLKILRNKYNLLCAILEEKKA